MNIRLFTDLRFTGSHKLTGVGKHIIQMANGLAGTPGVDLKLAAARDQLDAAGTVPTTNALSRFPARKIPLNWKTAEALWTLTGGPIADRWIGEADWVYCPKNDFIPTRRCRFAVTIHGAHELDPHFPQPTGFSAALNRLRRRVSYRRMLNAATLVVTVSEFLKEQIVDWFQVDPDKIAVVGNGVEEYFYQAGAAMPSGHREADGHPYVLAVGGLNFLDGGDRVVNFASLLSRRAPEFRVVVAGMQHDEASLQAVAKLPNVKLLGYVPAEKLALLLRDATALLYPTRYETFGIAAAEAMAAGTPVITCKSTAVPEVVGNDGIYTDPDEPEAILDALLSLQSQPRLRNDLVTRGRLRAEKYTWAACVTRLHEALVQRGS